MHRLQQGNRIGGATERVIEQTDIEGLRLEFAGIARYGDHVAGAVRGVVKRRPCLSDEEQPAAVGAGVARELPEEIVRLRGARGSAAVHRRIESLGRLRLWIEEEQLAIPTAHRAPAFLGEGVAQPAAHAERAMGQEHCAVHSPKCASGTPPALFPAPAPHAFPPTRLSHLDGCAGGGCLGDVAGRVASLRAGRAG